MLRCCGASIGCTATSKDPYSPNNNLSRYMSREDQISRWGKKIKSARLCFLTCGIMSAIAIIVMIVDGLSGLNSVASDFDSSLQVRELVSVVFHHLVASPCLNIVIHSFRVIHHLQ